MSIVQKYLFNSRIYRKILISFKGVYFHNLDINLYEILQIFYNKLQENNTKQRAYAVAFNFTMAIFPSIIFLFTLIPYIPDIDVEKVLDFLDEILPNSFYVYADGTIHDIISKPRGGLLSFGFFTALYLATNGMTGLMDAFNSIYHNPKKRTFLREKWIATALTFFLATILILAIFLLVLGNIILKLLIDYGILNQDFIIYLINVLRLVIVFFMFFFGTSVIYYYAPSVPARWNFFSIGSFIATVLCVLVSLIFSYYMDNFGTYNKLYGSIGAMIGMMFWLFAISLVLLVGFEINATLDIAKDKKQE
ncbi:YihY/virulence factor BrkB family protein [Flexithrix dorotheae]|uniref:YihY/virulence factor BrkB family protein n=1 Tax=Flexithrix dorotheae TaxID=70993 RepID=UPI000368F076|nr:YihY/virulence factor BrkB family protein [Flexithrix dorotheae]